MKVALVGATGMVGKVMLRVLKERDFPITQLIPVASSHSIGNEISFNGRSFKIVSMEDAVSMAPQIALFSAGGDASKEWAPKFEAVGTTVIDNSSAWRMSAGYKLVVPEINAGELTAKDKIIANPNCSTIQMVMALFPLHNAYGIKRVVVSTYQSVSGTGKAAVQQMENERTGVANGKVYPHKIDKNCLPHCDVFLDNGYTKEEMKLVDETRKILGDESIMLSATAVRVPVEGGHSEAINVEFKKDFDIAEVKRMLEEMPGVIVQDDNANNSYPMPLYSKDKDDVFVGRIRRDESQANTLNLWVVADNLRKGAATNAVQIAEFLYDNQLV